MFQGRLFEAGVLNRAGELPPRSSGTQWPLRRRSQMSQQPWCANGLEIPGKSLVLSVDGRLKELGSVCLCSPGCSVGDVDFEPPRAACLCILSAGVSLAKKLDSDVRKDGKCLPERSKHPPSRRGGSPRLL